MLKIVIINVEAYVPTVDGPADGSTLHKTSLVNLHNLVFV
jgi:hypothetical protein